MKGLIATYVLTYGGAAASIISPYIGLLVYVCFAIVKPESMWYWSVPEGNYSRIVAITFLVGWVLHGCGKWQLGQARGIVLALLGFWLWAAFSAVQAPEKAAAFAYLESLAKIVLPFVVGMTLIDSVQKLKLLAWVIVLSQGYVAFEMNLSYLNGFNRVVQVGFGGMDNNCIAISMVTGVGLAFFLGLYGQVWWQRGLAFAAALLMAHTILLTFSRGGMVALILTGFSTVFLIRMQPKYYIVLVIAVMLGLRLSGPEVRERFFTIFADKETRDESGQSRLNLWSSCLSAIEKRPIFGAGPSHWPLIAAEYGWPAGKEAHTLWLQVGAELGVPGLLLLLSFYLMCVKRLWPIARGRLILADPWLQTGAAMVISSLVGFMVAAQFVSLVGLELPYYAVMLGAGVLKLASAEAVEDTEFQHAEAMDANSTWQQAAV